MQVYQQVVADYSGAGKIFDGVDISPEGVDVVSQVSDVVARAQTTKTEVLLLLAFQKPSSSKFQTRLVTYPATLTSLLGEKGSWEAWVNPEIVEKVNNSVDTPALKRAREGDVTAGA